MIRIYTAADPIFVGYLQGLLDDRGIGSLIRNQWLQGGAGELPPNECWPELWIIDPRDETLSRQIVEEQALIYQERLRGGENAEKWSCANCGESSEDQFTACWKCGYNRESSSELGFHGDLEKP